MNISMDWGTLNINVPKDEMLLIQSVPVEIRQLDLTDFRYAMHDKQDDEAGMAYMHMHEHNPPVTVAGVTLAQVVTIVNNYTVTFEDGLYNVNIVGGNSNVADKVVKNQVGVNTSNSAGLQDSTSLQAASFGGHVTVDNNNGFSGTVFPIGTNRYPCLTLQDAITIANREGIDEILFKSPYGLGIGDDVSGFYLRGVSHAIAQITIEPGATCHNTIFTTFQISGTLDDDCEIHDSIIGDIDYFNGFIFHSAFDGTINLSGDKDASFTNCKMHDINNIPIINAGGTGQDLIMTEWSGILNIQNITGESKIGIGCSAGSIVIEDTCVNGTISTSGTGSLIDNSSNDCYVINTLVDGSEIMNLTTIIEHLRPHHTGTGKIIYWNPYSGNDIWDGDHPDRAFKTFAKSHDTAENANHDTIMIVPGDPNGVTTITEQISVTKDYLFIRGPGRDVLVVQDTLEDTCVTNARGTEFSGFRIQNTTIDGHGVHSTGAFTLLENLWFEDCENGTYMSAHHPLIHSCKFHGVSGYAIKIEGDVSHGEIYDCTAGDAGETAIQINTTETSGGIKMRDTVIMSSDGYGVSLSATTRKFVSESGNVVEYNALGAFDDLGYDNVLNIEGSSTGGLSESDLHNGLDSYTNKDNWKADVSYLEKAIYVDTDAIVNGDGSQGNPFDNVNDSKDMAELTGIKKIYASGDITVPGNLKGMNVHGIGLVRINLNGQDVKKSKFYNCSLSGTYTDSIMAEKCMLEDGFMLSGNFDSCKLHGEVVVNSTNEILMYSCVAGINGSTISMNSGIASNIAFRDFKGEMLVTNSDHVNDIINIENTGSVVIDDSCVNGTIKICGLSNVTDNSNGSTVIDNTVNLNSISTDVWTYLTRELTVASGLTPEQETKIDNIIVDISEIPALVLDEVAPWVWL